MKDYEMVILDTIQDQIQKFLAELARSPLEDPAAVKMCEEILKEISQYRETPEVNRKDLEGFGLLGKLLPRLWV